MCLLQNPSSCMSKERHEGVCVVTEHNVNSSHFISSISQTTNLPQGTLQSVQHMIPSSLKTSFRRRKNIPLKSSLMEWKTSCHYNAVDELLMHANHKPLKKRKANSNFRMSYSLNSVSKLYSRHNELFHNTLYWMTMLKGDEPSENYQLNLQLASALWSFMVSFSSLLSCAFHNFAVWFTLTTLCCFHLQQPDVFREKALKSLCTQPALHQTAGRQSETSWWTRWNASNSLIFSSGVRRDQNRDKSRLKIGFRFIKWTQIWLQINDDDDLKVMICYCRKQAPMGDCYPLTTC